MIDMCNFPKGENIDMIFADNYLNDGSKANFLMPEYNHVMGGTCIIAGFDPSDGSAVSLTQEQAETAINYIKKNQVFYMDISDAFAYLQYRQKILTPTNQQNAELEM